MDLQVVVESVLREESLENMLINSLGMDQMQAREIMKDMSFSDYIEVQNRLDKGDVEGVGDLLGISPQTENSYSAARAQTQELDPELQQQQQQMPGPLDIPDLEIGDEIETDKGVARVTKVNDLGDTTTYTTDKSTQLSTSGNIQPPAVDVTDDDAIKGEIERLQQLAGIETDIEEAGTMKGGAIASGAMAGAVAGKNKIKKFTHKNMKPGPKPKKGR